MNRYVRRLTGQVSVDPANIKEHLIARRGSRCEHCGRMVIQDNLEAHHCLIHRMKGHPELDGPENLMLVCHACHESGEVNAWEVRRKFWRTQIVRGYDMVAWLASLPLKVKPNFFNEKENNE